MRLIETHSPGTIGSILLLDEEGRRLHHGAAPSLPAAYTAAIDGEPIGERAGSCGTAAFRREPVIVEDIETDPLWAAYRHVAREHGLRACWSTPIFDRHDRLVGTFALYCRSPRRPSRQDLRLVDYATSTAGIAIGREWEGAALRDAIERIADHAGLKAEFVDESGGIVPDPVLATAVFRVAQEALTNITRHARARHVVVELRVEAGSLVLVVGDDGVGFDYDAARARAVKGTSMGILGMEERVALAGGSLRVTSKPGQGTHVQATFPLAGRAEALAS